MPGNDDQRDHASYDQPLNGPRKGGLGPLVLTIAVLAVVLAIFGLITWVRYAT